MSLEDQPQSGRPSTSRNDENIQKIRDAIMFDHRRTVSELEALTGVSWSSCQWILTEELHMKRVAAKFIPRMLSEDQRVLPTQHWVCGSFSWKTGWQRLCTPPAPWTWHSAIFSFPRMKRDIKGKRFQNVEEVRKKITEALKAITLQEFQNCVEQ